MKNLIAALFITLTSASILFTFSAHAAPAFIEHEEIRRQIKQFLTEKIRHLDFQETQIEVGHIDKRLRLSACDNKLEITMGNNRLPGNLSLAVQCYTGKPWKIYLQATVNAYQSIYVARGPIPRGSQLSESELILEKHNITSLGGNYLTDINLIKSYVASRAIRKGEVIKPFMLVKSKLVKRGEQVTLVAETSGIKVRMMGKALNDATAGQIVRVKNNNSKRIVEGTAINRGVVQINM